MMGLIVLTGVPQIIWREILRRSPDPQWFRKFALAIPLGVLILALGWPPARALAGFSIVLSIQIIGYGIAQILVTKRVMQRMAPGARALHGMSAAGAFKVVPVLLLLPALFAAGHGGRLFLGAGDLSRPVRLPGWDPGISWMAMFGLAVLGTVAFLIVYARSVRPGQPVNLRNVARFAPLIIFASLVNAFTEEFLYRNALLPFLIPVMGTGQAVWLSSLRFGIVHFYGTPSGVIGVLAATLFGLVLGLSMVQTGGSGFAWALHVIADLVIFGAAAAMWPKRARRQESEASGERSLENVELG